MHRRALTSLLLVAISAPSCRSGGSGTEAPSMDGDVRVPDSVQPVVEPTPFRRVEGERFRVDWRPVPNPLPLNESFAMEIRLLEPGPGVTPWPGADLVIDAWMPAHRHGMLRRPEVFDLGEGRYRVEGLLFHMRGHWEVRFDVIGADGRRQRVTTDVHLP